MIKKCETCGINYKYCDCFFEYINFKDDLIEYKCLCCNNTYQQKFDEKLKEQFFITYKCSNHDNNKFLLLMQKVFNILCLNIQLKFISNLNLHINGVVKW